MTKGLLTRVRFGTFLQIIGVNLEIIRLKGMFLMGFWGVFAPNFRDFGFFGVLSGGFLGVLRGFLLEMTDIWYVFGRFPKIDNGYIITTMQPRISRIKETADFF